MADFSGIWSIYCTWSKLTRKYWIKKKEDFNWLDTPVQALNFKVIELKWPQTSASLNINYVFFTLNQTQEEYFFSEKTCC